VIGDGPATIADWSNEIDLSKLLQNTQVKGILGDKIPSSTYRSGRDWFANPISEFYAKVGVRCTKTQNATFSRPAGKVLVSILFSLADKIKNVQQETEACTLFCSIPSDFRTAKEGDMVLEVIRLGTGRTMVNAKTKIEGQLYDWGKSKKMLKKLFEDIERGTLMV
jgi:hypothetical protein